VYHLAVSQPVGPVGGGGDQRYALVVELQECERQKIALYVAVLQQARVRARDRLSG
jgi:hypothetical protein